MIENLEDSPEEFKEYDEFLKKTLPNPLAGENTNTSSKNCLEYFSKFI